MRFPRHPALPALSALVLSLSIARAPAAAPDVRISEILAGPARDWDGSGVFSSRDDEWIEIVNAGPTPVSLDEYRVSDGGTTMFRYGFSGMLGPGAVRLVLGSESVAWEMANGVSTTGLSLNNAGDAVRLWRVVGPDTTLADSYAYASFEVLDDRSVARVPDGASTWQLFDGLNPYSGTTPPFGTGCNPTPGAANACPTAVEPAAWTRIKRLYEEPAR